MTTTPTIWKSEFTANIGATVGAQFNPYTIGLANGNFLVAWSDTASGTSFGTDIFGRIYDPEGNPVGAPFQLNTAFFVDNEFLGSVAPTADGGFVMAYIDDEGASPDAIRIERYDANGTRTFTGSITGAAGDVSDPEITVAANGSYLVTFTRVIAGDVDVRGVIFSSTNVAGVEFDAGQNSSDRDADSDAAALTGGNFAIAYEEDDAAVTGIELKIVNSAGGFVSNLQVAAAGFDPRVTALTGGNVAVVWQDAANNGDIRFSIFTAAGASVASQVLVAGGGNLQNEPQIVGLKDGGFYVVWDDDTTDQLLGRRFSATGAPVGVTQPLASGITEPELGLTSDGRILVTFQNSAGEISEIILDPRDNVINGTAGNDILTTQVGSTTIFGGSGQDTILGQGGNDQIFGGLGEDTVSGGGGNDRFHVLEGEFSDNVDGGSGIDTLDLSDILANGSGGDGANIDLLSGTWTLNPAFPGIQTIINVENIVGTQGDDVIAGNGPANNIQGQGGDDIINGVGNNDTLAGQAGNDQLTGGGGNDVLIGGAGFDTMTGNVGTDRFDFDSTAEIGVNAGARDVVTDFAAGGPGSSVDRIDLATIDAKTGVGGNQAFVFGGAPVAGHVIAVQSGADVLIRLFTDGDAAPEAVIQLNNVNVANINAGDFIL